MSEGPEPQEFFEHVERRHHDIEEEPKHTDKFTMKAALIASILAVLAALTSILAGHTINGAILKQIDATDAWATYQSDTTKANIYEASKFIVESITSADQKANDTKSQSIISELAKKADLYAKIKIEKGHEAKEMSLDSHKELKKHQQFSLAMACFQIGIVIASVAIIVRKEFLYHIGILAGIIGTTVTIFGLRM